MEPREPPQEALISSCPDEIKLEILKHIDDVLDLCRFSCVCRTWNEFLRTEKIWKPLFVRDFLWWNPKQELKLQNGESWKQKYQEFFRKGWQWDPSHCNNNITVSEDCLSVLLKQGFSYNGVRANRGENSGRHYFEVQITENPYDKRFTQGHGSVILMGIGVATDRFNVHNCSVGWTNDNNGIGYYSDGQIYALGNFYSSPTGKRPYYAGDRIAMEFDFDNGKITFFVNDEQVTDAIAGLKEELHFPFLILAADVKNSVVITRGKGTRRIKKLGELSKQQYQNELETLKNMGFFDEELCIDLLRQYNGNLERVVDEMVENQI